MSKSTSSHTRPVWPRRAVVTAGMPYGNKALHFGHVGGVFVPADFFARFLRDRLGKEQVLFVSGTDCYGSPIMEGYRKKQEQEHYAGSLADYVQAFHDEQAQTLADFEVALDIYAGSALEPAAAIHQQVSTEVIEQLHRQGHMAKRSTLQFYDPQAKQFLNGRQVLGHCPIAGCKSEKAYADECDLGHQFEPQELIAPKSALTGCVPELLPVDNLYFDLPKYRDFLREHVKQLEADGTTRSVVSKTMAEWLLSPQIHIQTRFREAYDVIASKLPKHELQEASEGKSSFSLVFSSWEQRDQAYAMLTEAEIRFRSGKALVPFRITGNISWGVPAPEIDGTHGLTCWCWPESLWAPISFSRTVLAREAQLHNQAQGYDVAHDDALRARFESEQTPIEPPTKLHSSLDWHDWWCSEDAGIYQFIGQDNIYFYGIAQPAMWEALTQDLNQSHLVANYHLLYMGKKASSSSETPPPLASQLLDHYTAEQLRAHWISLGLGEKPVSFSPKAFDTRITGKTPDGEPLAACDDTRVIDPVLKEGAMLTGVFNRLARSCFYGVAQKEGDESAWKTGCIPAGAPQPELIELAHTAVLAFEMAMHRFELHHALSICDEYIRAANKRWGDASKQAKDTEDEALQSERMLQALRDAFYELRIATMLMHGIVPAGCELIAKHFALNADDFFSWEHIFDTTDELLLSLGKCPGEHKIIELPPRFDFFRKHESQRSL
ncbi:class I tRNA ligase family protein [Collinsella sp. zg1085]|uniref:class I tRNA ligase family protein n=1 Tax=Collinsella sp. zg1085 TaxID=2844380 RepID=UPI001C0D5DCD|nr:class I tRNA ligase family protein [Collinsella sp. zg1085]QWT17257.1 class I tRNA ligase family protein [Collinsella sp. zg1085]